MRGRVRGNSNALWLYGGSGDVGRYEHMTSDGLTTTEDATECTDVQIRNTLRSYPPVYPVYSSRLAGTSHPQYYYPTKKRSRRRFVPLTCPMHHEGKTIMPAQPQLFFPSRKSSRRSLVVGPRRRAAHTFTQPSLPPFPPSLQPDQVRKGQKVLVYSSTYPAQPEEIEQKAKVFWHRVKKYPRKGNMVGLCSQAIDSSTDAKSVRSNYSRLSVDVTNEMAAMNRDIDTILTQYETAFDNTIINELEERGLGKKKKKKPEPNVVPTLPQLTLEQQNLLSMEKPPLDRLGEIPIEYLKPRPPTSATVKETEKSNSLNGTAIWKGMLQDLVNRGIMDKLDETSLAKLQSALNETALSASSPSVSPIANSCPKKKEKTADVTVLSGATCSLRPEEKTVLSEVDAQFQKPTYSINYTSTAATRASYETLPNLVERSEDLIPVGKVNDDTNWRKKLEEIKKEASKSHCEGCKTLTEQLNVFQRGGSGDKLVFQDKSVNTDVGQELDDNCSRNLSSGDRNTSDGFGISRRSLVQVIENSSTTSVPDNVKEVSSNITVNSMLTGGSKNSVSSGNTSHYCEDSTTNPSSVVETSRVIVEDVDEGELPLIRKCEKTSLGNLPGKGISSKLSARRSVKPISLSSQQGSRTQPSGYRSAPDGTRIAKEGAGDSPIIDASSDKKEMSSLIWDISMGENSSLGQNLTVLSESISRHKELIDRNTCLNIIEKVTNLMLSNETVDSDDRNKTTFSLQLERMQQSHIHHIQQEVHHLKYLYK